MRVTDLNLYFMFLIDSVFLGILQGRDERDSTTVQAPSTQPSLPEHFDIRDICVGIPKVQLHSVHPLGDSSLMWLTAGV